MSKLLGEIGRGYARSGIIYIFSSIIMLSLMCVLICLPLWLVTRLDAPEWILFLTGGMLLLILFGSIPVVLIGTYQVRKKRLDKVFLPLGLEGEKYMMFFRKYHGLVDETNVAVRFYRGPVLEIETGTSLDASVVFSQTRPSRLSDLMGESPVQVDLPALGETKIYSHDETFVHLLVQNPEFVDLIVGLTMPTENFLYRHLIMRPEKLMLMSAFSSRLFGYDLDPVVAQQWVKEVIQVSYILEDIAVSKN
jgi:hypothetical protein